ncbi:hypothetical protein [Blastococcus aggregatus]|uniref:hypothetical protein n=1 Tax=Blastococcus aggregatus TaxID=38502 RepID=UPI001143B03E|nr:hypothetical protein [Blastococcus aggregatus]
MRTLTVTRLEHLPRLAWLVQLDQGSDTVSATVGPWVDARPDAVFEGTWAGDVSSDFSDSFSLFGSGVLLRGDELVVAAPCHTMEAVYSVRHDGKLAFSNSIAFLLEAVGVELDMNYLGYEADALSIRGGLDSYHREWPLADGARLGVHFYCNVVVNAAGELREERKPVPPRVGSWQEYRGFLGDQMAAVHANATHAGRVHTYPPIVFSSNGYDSSACAALGKEIGCNEAVVFESKRASRSDSGRDVVTALGYTEIHEKHELDYRDTDTADLFVANGELGTSMYFAAAELELTGKMLLSGAYGDRAWDRTAKVNDQVRRYVPLPDTSRKEFRLAAGYLMVAPAYLSTMHLADVVAISNSPEMAPWTLHNDYDRPIPRRVVEEAGVPRELFGQHKDGGAGTSLRFGTLAQLRRTMPSKSLGRFTAYLGEARKRRNKLRPKYLLRVVAYGLYLFTAVLDTRGVKKPIRVLQDRWPIEYQCSPFAPSYLFPWGVSEVRSAYRASP